jgi:hypothetical protein
MYSNTAASHVEYCSDYGPGQGPKGKDPIREEERKERNFLFDYVHVPDAKA